MPSESDWKITEREDEMTHKKKKKKKKKDKRTEDKYDKNVKRSTSQWSLGAG